MIHRLLVLLAIVTGPLHAQQIQLHADPRHALDPRNNPKNFPTLYFEYFRTFAPDSSFVRPGSFLFKMQADLLGDMGSVGKVYLQASQTVKFWRPDIFLDLEYSGGLGIAEPGASGYYIVNTFSTGLSLPVRWNDTWVQATLAFTYTTFASPSADLRSSVYWWKAFGNYEMEFAGDIQAWTQNRNHGDAFTAGQRGKRLAIFGEPQVWFHIIGNFSAGTKVNLYYHVVTYDEVIQIYPTLAVRYKFQ